MRLALSLQCLLLIFTPILFALNITLTHNNNNNPNPNITTTPLCSLGTAGGIPVPLAQGRGVRMHYEIHLCEDLRLAYVHVYKNAGTSILTQLRRFCEAATLKPTLMFANWAPAGPKLTRLEDLCSLVQCFSFWREPVGRLLSGYHEAMRRTHASAQMRFRYRDLMLGPGAIQAQKIANLERFLGKVEKRTLVNAHVVPQVKFLRQAGYNWTTGVVFPLSTLTSVLPAICCGALAACNPSAECPMEAATLGQDRGRNRLSEDYGMSQYILDERELPDRLIQRIVEMFREDYCALRIPLHPRADAHSFSCP